MSLEEKRVETIPGQSSAQPYSRKLTGKQGPGIFQHQATGMP